MIGATVGPCSLYCDMYKSLRSCTFSRKQMLLRNVVHILGTVVNCRIHDAITSAMEIGGFRPATEVVGKHCHQLDS
jgi:hypothetical protein